MLIQKSARRLSPSFASSVPLCPLASINKHLKSRRPECRSACTHVKWFARALWPRSSLARSSHDEDVLSCHSKTHCGTQRDTLQPHTRTLQHSPADRIYFDLPTQRARCSNDTDFISRFAQQCAIFYLSPTTRGIVS